MAIRLTPRLVVRSKIVPARIPDALVVRQRLLARLSTGAPFTLVAAMPGYGKTVAVRQWIDTIDGPVAWLSLDLLDEDPMSFWSDLLLALGSVLPGLDEEPSMLLAERGVTSRLFLGALIVELERRKEPVLLVLDGLERSLDRTILDGLALLVDRVGHVLKLVVTSRTDPALPFARWRSAGWFNELREEDLRLTDDEAIEVADRLELPAGDPEDIVALNRSVDGWPIGLHMALLSRQPAAGDQPRSGEAVGSNRILADYLVAEVLDTLSEQERDVALSLSVVKWFDPDLCRELVGPHAHDAVRQLLGRGVFLTVVDPQVGAMRFHAVFRELMEMELSWRDPARRVDLHRRAAMLWRARGDLTAAYGHLSAIDETDRAHELLVEPALELVDRGDRTALDQFAQQLPSVRDVDDVNLALDLAIVALHTHGPLAAHRWCDRAAALIDQAAATAERPDDPEGDDLRLRLHDLTCAIALLDADLDTVLDAIETRGGLAAKARNVHVFNRRFPIVAARALLAARRMDDADHWIQLAERITGPDIVTAVTVPTLRAWHEWLFGRLDRGTALIDGALAWIDDHHIEAHYLAFDTFITGGWCRLSTGDLAGAARLAQRARHDADALDCAWNRLQAGFLSARLAFVMGDPLATLRIVEDLRSRIRFDTCRPYADRILGLEIEALAASQRLDAAAGLDALEPGPRTQLLRARFGHAAAEALLADRASWPVLERLQAELIISARGRGVSPSDELVALVEECATSGWVLPFLGSGTLIEEAFPSSTLEELHPQLARTLADVAPVSYPSRPDGNGVRLTGRERTLLELLPTHLSYAEMGERLYLSVNTVKGNLKTLYRKLDASTRTEAVAAGQRAGFL
jgi:LuxR family transcriptional regulator, maltose regulon positive regulatory protein